MNEDPKLRLVLQTWQVTPPAVPEFEKAVWRQIEEERQPTAPAFWSALREWLFVQLPRPAYASVLLLLTAAAGVAAANARAGHVRDHERLENARQYLASIDPIAMNSRSFLSGR